MKLPRVPSRTTPGFAFSTINRALRECLSRRDFGQQEMAEVLAFFGTDDPECVFCGSREVRRWDHLVPINGGGETVLGNMVPACARCDDSKRHLPFEEWMISDARHSPKSRDVQGVDQRIARIKAYVQHFGYRVQPQPERLNEQERQRLSEIESMLQKLREEIDALIADYRGRTGHT